MRPADSFELDRIGVEGDDHRPPAQAFEGVPARAATEVQHPIGRPQPETAEVDGQHASSS